MPADTLSGAVSPVALRGQWMRLFLHGLAEAGLEHVVVSPGSRNTPLIAAFLDDERFVCHSVLDERAAGFFALGLGRALGATVGLCCTSGSAGAHYLPALIEADASALGLLVVTADRPVELQDCGAEQTITQPGMFGRFSIAFEKHAGALTVPSGRSSASATGSGSRPGAEGSGAGGPSGGA